MKIYKYIISIIFTGLIIISACKDESTFVLNPDEIPNGVFVYMDIITPVLNISDLENSSFEATIIAPSENVSLYEMSVSWFSNGVSSDTVPLKSFTAFPADLSVNANELASVLGVTISDFLAGDAFNIVSTVHGIDGSVATFDDLDQDAGTNPGERQAFNYTIYISCPFDANEAAGTYFWTQDPWDTYLDDGIFEVVAGPGENQITCIDVFDHPVPDDPTATYDMIIDVNPETGVATVVKQNTWHPSNWGIPDEDGWGTGTHEGGGFVFSCSGTISLILDVSMDLGGWGPQIYVANKVTKSNFQQSKKLKDFKSNPPKFIY